MAAPTKGACVEGSAISKKKAKNISTKATLLNPFQIKWPVIPKPDQEQVFGLLKSKLQPLKLAYEKSGGRKKRESLLKQNRVEMDPESRKLRSQLAIGINHVTRALEKDQLRLALINRDVEPAMMTKHLATLCAVRECPVLCLPGLADTLGPLLNLKSVVAIGFKKISAEEDQTFTDLVEAISRKALQIEASWLGEELVQSLENNDSVFTKPDVAEKNAEAVEESSLEEINIDKDKHVSEESRDSPMEKSDEVKNSPMIAVESPEGRSEAEAVSVALPSDRNSDEVGKLSLHGDEAEKEDVKEIDSVQTQDDSKSTSAPSVQTQDQPDMMDTSSGDTEVSTTQIQHGISSSGDSKIPYKYEPSKSSTVDYSYLYVKKTVETGRAEFGADFIGFSQDSEEDEVEKDMIISKFKRKRQPMQKFDITISEKKVKDVKKRKIKEGRSQKGVKRQKKEYISSNLRRLVAQKGQRKNRPTKKGKKEKKKKST